ncbi:MAG: inositol monophosphatase family protein [Balneolaceae bacterium]
MQSEKQRDLDVALKAARNGVEVIKSFETVDLNTRKKGRNDLITDADIATEKAVLKTICDVFPDDEVLAEESASHESLSARRTWIVDPIDGTTNFAHRFPIYCVSIALWENRKPRVAVVIEVNRDEEFTAVAGEGAWLNGQPISVADTAHHRDGFVATGFPYNDLSLVEPYLKLFRILMEELQGLRRPGAASYDLCCVACGRFDGFYEYSLHAWDVAAAALIIQEAGGVVTDWEGGENWLFGQRLVAGNRTIHRYLLDQIQAVIPAAQRKSLEQQS